MKKLTKTAGFTLVEVIITLVVVAIMGAMLVSVLGTSMTKSSDPIFRMQTSFALQRVMENMITGYEKYYAGDLSGFNGSIGVEGSVVQGSDTAIVGYCPQSASCKYTVFKNHFIKFDSNVEVPAGENDPKNLLKVTIKNSNNETLTYIFAG